MSKIDPTQHYAHGMNELEYRKWYWRKNKTRLDTFRREYAKTGRYKLTHKNCALKSNYGISLEQFNQKCLEQQNRCAICKEVKTLCVDHCHKTQIVRGLLCHRCNLALGLFHEDLNLLAEFKKYLELYA